MAEAHGGRVKTSPHDKDTDGHRSLDPDSWEELRELAHAMLDMALDHHRNVRRRPVWQPLPEDVKTALQQELPCESEGAESVCRDLIRCILPYGTGNIHPRFFGWVHGTGTPGGIVAEMMAAAINGDDFERTASLR